MSADPASVQTSRRLASVDARMTLRGRLLTAHVAVKQIDRAGTTVPVLVLELEDVGAGHHNVTAHVPYTNETRGDAERLARRLKRDQVIDVESSLVDVRLFLPAASCSMPTEEGEPHASNHPHDH
jgi:hypothetical protein